MHCEQVVKPKVGKGVWAIKAVIILFSFLLCNFIFSNIMLTVGMYGALVYPLVFWIIWMVFRSMNFEFEYSFTEGTLFVAKIIAKSKRTSLTACDVKKALAYGKVTDLPERERRSPSIPCVYAQGGERESIMYIEYPVDGGKRKRLYFSPDENIRAAVEQQLPFLIKQGIRK